LLFVAKHAEYSLTGTSYLFVKCQIFANQFFELISEVLIYYINVL